MDFTIDELAALVEGRVVGGSGEARISGVASLAEAGPGDITFFGNPRYLPALKSTRAGCVLVPEAFDDEIQATQIRVANPVFEFSKVVARFAPEPIVFPAGIHPSAVIAPGVRLGDGVSIQANAVIEAGAEIGDRTVIGANCYVGHAVRIGSGCLIYPNVSIRERCVLGNRVLIASGAVIGSDGYGFETIGGKHVKIPQTGIVVIEDDVEIGGNAVIDRARFGKTLIGEGTKIDNLVHLAHNVQLGKHCLIAGQVGIAGSTRVGNYVAMAGQVGLVGHIEIADGVIIGAKSGVSKGIPNKGFYWGSPAGPIADQKEKVALVNRLPKLVERVKGLERIVADLVKKFGV